MSLDEISLLVLYSFFSLVGGYLKQIVLFFSLNNSEVID